MEVLVIHFKIVCEEKWILCDTSSMLSSAKWHAAADNRLSDCGKVVSG